jgi:hypothetical protein
MISLLWQSRITIDTIGAQAGLSFGTAATSPRFWISGGLLLTGFGSSPALSLSSAARSRAVTVPARLVESLARIEIYFLT